MKKQWKIAAVIDGVLLVILFCLMAWLNNRPAYGLSALEGTGRFVVCYVLFQLALAAAIVLAVLALITYIRKRRK